MSPPVFFPHFEVNDSRWYTTHRLLYFYIFLPSKTLLIVMGQIIRCCHLSKLGVLKLPVREPSLTCKFRAPNIQATFMWVCLKIIGRLQTHGNSPLLDVHVLGQHQSPVVYRECIPLVSEDIRSVSPLCLVHIQARRSPPSWFCPLSLRWVERLNQPG